MNSEPIPGPRLKRVFDRAVALVLSVLAAPVFVIAFAAQAIDMVVCRRDRGPFLYREPRVSRGRTFSLLKLRTLRCDALATQQSSEAHARLLEADPANLTWAGRRVLKPWYLDELPQLVNVLRGELSLVGPRPWPPSLVREQVAAGLDYRNRVTAGWTGPVQVRKGLAEPEEYAALDLGYVEACRTLSGPRLVRHDLNILWRTVKLIARGEGLKF